MHLFSMRKADPYGLATLIARRRVQRGILWLNSVRPHDWWKHLYRGEPGSRFFHARDEYDIECPLALAFKSDETLRLPYYVTYASVANRFNLKTRWLRAHGFLEQPNPAKGPLVTSKVLNKAWEKEVGESSLIIRRILVFPGDPSPAEVKRKQWIQRLMQGVRIKRIMRGMKTLQPS